MLSDEKTVDSGLDGQSDGESALDRMMANTKKLAAETELRLKEKTIALTERINESGVKDKFLSGADAAVTGTLTVGAEVYLRGTDIFKSIAVRSHDTGSHFPL